MGPQAAVLCAALDRLCGADKNRFNALVKDPKGYDLLEAHVEGTLESKDAAAVARACQYGPPLAPLLRGLRGQFYDGTDLDKLALERLEPRAFVDDRKLAHPKNRQDKVSASWSGYLLVDKPGDYSFGLTGDDRAILWLDGKAVSTSLAGQEKLGNVKLAAGLRPFRLDFHQTAGNSRVQVWWAGPGFSKQDIPSARFRAPAWPGGLADLAKAAATLASGNAGQVAAAQDVLRAADPVGRIFLRNALRHGSNAALLGRAMDALVSRRDEATAPLLTALLKKAPAGPLAGRLLSALRDLAAQIGPQDASWLLDLPKKNPKLDKQEHAALLCAILERACGGDKAKFTALVKDPKAYDQLKTTVETALAGKDDKQVAWACEYGGPFAPLLKGLAARYFAGRHFEQLALRKVEPTIEVAERKFPMPGNRQDHISAWWSGLLVIDKPGKHTFHAKSDDGECVWVDGKVVVDGWLNAAGQDKQAVVNLAKGTHAFDVAFHQRDQHATISVQWSPPGAARQALPETVLRTHAWDKELAKLPPAVRLLASKNAQQKTAAKETLTKAQEVGKVYLRNAIRHQSVEIAKQAAELLQAMGDKDAQKLLAERLKATKPAAP